MEVTVVIPVYNNVIALKRAIQSVLNQTVANHLIVVDDFSTEDVKSVVESFNSPHIEYHKLDKKGNGNVARNVGINKAETPFVALLDSDDEWLPNHLEDKLPYLKGKDYDMVFGSYKYFDGSVFHDNVSRGLKREEKLINYVLSGGYAQTSTYVMKTNTAKTVLFDEALHRHQDYDFIARFGNAFPVINSKEITVLVYWETNNASKQNIDATREFIKKHEKIIEPKNYHTFFRNMYILVKDQAIAEEEKTYLFQEGIRYKKHLTLTEYLSWENPQGVISKIYHRFKFILYLLT